jgi:transcriptional regulator with XRE-family HTH domain
MHNSFALDLKVARRKAGLSQRECAHLLDVHQTKISQLETGKVIPSIHDICALSLIFGKSFESLFTHVFDAVRAELHGRVASLPESDCNWITKLNRNHTLNQLQERLSGTNDTDHDTV